MLDSFMFIMVDEEFEKLCRNHLGLDNANSVISYQEFLHKFEVLDTPDGHKWLNSMHRYSILYYFALSTVYVLMI